VGAGGGAGSGAGAGAGVGAGGGGALRVAQAASDAAAAAIRASLTMALVLGITNFSFGFIDAADEDLTGSKPVSDPCQIKTINTHVTLAWHHERKLTIGCDLTQRA
jgi:hypothetical protein